MKRLVIALALLFSAASFAQPKQFLSMHGQDCTQTEEVRPVCSNIGTDQEGWYANDELMNKLSGEPFLTNCFKAKVECVSAAENEKNWSAWGIVLFSRISRRCKLRE